MTVRDRVLSRDDCGFQRQSQSARSDASRVISHAHNV